jgi:hypothetical protein
MLMALCDQGKWVFNPPDDYVARPGVAIVLMANPGGRALAEELVRRRC